MSRMAKKGWLEGEKEGNTNYCRAAVDQEKALTDEIRRSTSGAPGTMALSMTEFVFEVTQEADGGLVAECLTEAIFTQADTWEDLRSNVREAVAAYFADGDPPPAIRLHLVRDEVLATG